MTDMIADARGRQYDADGSGDLTVSARVKPWYVYWFWRIFVPVVWLIECSLGFLWMTTLNVVYLKSAFLGMPFYIPAILAWGSRYAFTPDYCTFGRYRRRPLPKTAPLRTIGESWDSFRTWAMAGRYHMGSIVLSLYREGIGIKTLCGKVFIPLDQLDGLDLLHGFDSYRHRDSTATLFHHSPEIYEPITVPDWIAEIIAVHYPDKVLPEAQAE